MQQQNYRKSAFTAILGSGLVATIIGLTTSTAFAQEVTPSALTVESTGTISGTLVLPKFNPNYNKNITSVDTDETGAYYRNGELVYQSDLKVLDDGSMKYYVNFKGIPVTSFDAIIDSPAFSDGEITTFRYDGRPDMEGAVLKGVVQDEFGIKKAYYTGIITDPKTGIQYQGKFELKAQGPRYSDANGSDSPNVFDYQSDLRGKPRAEPYKIQDNSPLVKLEIKVPEGTTIVSPPSTGGTTPPTTGGTTPPTTGGSTPPTTGGSTPTSTSGSTSPSTGGSTPTSIGGTTPSTNLAPSSSPITSSPSSPSPDVNNIEFSSGNSFVSNSVVENPSNFNKTACSQDFVCNATVPQPKQRGPSSRVIMR